MHVDYSYKTIARGSIMVFNSKLAAFFGFLALVFWAWAGLFQKAGSDAVFSRADISLNFFSISKIPPQLRGVIR
jgi:hypothetical protein